MSTMELPKKKSPALRKSPKSLVIYGMPKVGKTSALAKLEDCLIIDLEDGTDMLEALKVKVHNLKELEELGAEIIKQKKPYRYVAIDTVTKLEEWCEAEATQLYLKSPMGQNFWKKNPDKPSVLTLPNGGGYLWLRIAFKKWIDAFGKLADTVILVGHVRDKMLVDKVGNEVSAVDLDLTGKIKAITCAGADAIGYLYRDKEEDLAISFLSGKDIASGSRSEHLAGQKFKLDWSKIFID